MTKIYDLTIDKQPYTLTLTPPPQWGYCSGCWKNKAIRVISQPLGSLKRKFCGFCALDRLDKLSECDYKFKTAPEPIKEIRTFLLRNGMAKENYE